MKWIEFLKVQAAGTQGQRATPELSELIADIREKPGLVEADIYGHATVYGDFAVLLLWNTEQPPQEGSMAGLNLKQILKTYGLVNHTVWIIKENAQAQ